jgi:hypothetical protein
VKNENNDMSQYTKEYIMYPVAAVGSKFEQWQFSDILYFTLCDILKKF